MRPDGRMHRGIDFATPIGTPVAAPADAKVDRIWTDDEGGLTIRLDVQRPDGGFANETTVGDDSGFLVSFAHLSTTDVQEGQVVRRGDVIAHTGNSGQSTTGPHCHMQVEYFNDAPAWSLDSNQRVWVDPLGVMRDDVQAFDVMDAIYAPRGNEVSATPTTIIIRGDGAVQVGNGTAVNVPLKPVFSIYGSVKQAIGDGYDAVKGWMGGRGDLSAANPPVPDAARGVVNQLAGPVFGAAAPALDQARAIGGPVVEQLGRAVGGLAEKLGDAAIRFALDPNGAPVALQVVGGAANVVGSVLPIAGSAATAVAPAFVSGSAVPYVGAVLGAVGTGLEAFGVAASVAGPVVGILGGAVSATGASAQQVLKAIPRA